MPYLCIGNRESKAKCAHLTNPAPEIINNVITIKTFTIMSYAVERYRRRRIWSDPDSEELYYLKQVPGSYKIVTIEMIARQIETLGSLSYQDVTHSLEAFVRIMKENLVFGNKVKVDGLGIFQTTFNCTGAVEEKNCTVRNIRKVNIRLAVENTLRLANDSTATTRNAPNNVQFYIRDERTTDGSAIESEEGEGGEAPN